MVTKQELIGLLHRVYLLLEDIAPGKPTGSSYPFRKVRDEVERTLKGCGENVPSEFYGDPRKEL